MVAAGLLGMFLVQSAPNAGGLIAAQPGLTLADPVISVLWGVFAFHENVRAGWYIVPRGGQRRAPGGRRARSGPLSPPSRRRRGNLTSAPPTRARVR